MASWLCMGCRTAYAVGIPACPHCQSTDYSEGGDVKANANGGTLYVPEGTEVPAELAGVEGLQFVGPGAGEVTDDVPVKADPEPVRKRTRKAAASPEEPEAAE